MKFTPNLVVGIAITIVGIVLLLDRVELLAIRQVLHLWPVLLTLFGLSIVVQALKGERHGSTDAAGRPIVGPGLVLFLVIVSVIAVRTDGRRFSPSGTATDTDISVVGIMGRDDRVSLSPGFRGAQMTTVMGRTRLDLRQATLAPDGEAIIDVFGMMGTVEVIVPAAWTVDVQAHAIMGGTEDRRRPRQGQEPASVAPGVAPGDLPAPPASGASPPAATRLVIRGLVLMGALVIRS
jgi:hypothetical protein